MKSNEDLLEKERKRFDHLSTLSVISGIGMLVAGLITIALLVAMQFKASIPGWIPFFTLVLTLGLLLIYSFSLTKSTKNPFLNQD